MKELNKSTSLQCSTYCKCGTASDVCWFCIASLANVSSLKHLKDSFKSSCFVHILKKFFLNPNSVSFVTPTSHFSGIEAHPSTQARFSPTLGTYQPCTSPTARGTPALVHHSLWLRLQSTGRDKIRGPSAVTISKRTGVCRRLRHGKWPARMRYNDRHVTSGGVKVEGWDGEWVHGHRRVLWRVMWRLTCENSKFKDLWVKVTGSKSPPTQPSPFYNCVIP